MRMPRRACRNRPIDRATPTRAFLSMRYLRWVVVCSGPNRIDNYRWRWHWQRWPRRGPVTGPCGFFPTVALKPHTMQTSRPKAGLVAVGRGRLAKATRAEPVAKQPRRRRPTWGCRWCGRSIFCPKVLRTVPGYQNLFPIRPRFPGWKPAEMAEFAPREHRGGSVRGLLIRWSLVRVPAGSLATP